MSTLHEITLGHTPDADDAFMFYGLATNKLETGGLKFEHTLKDIQSLNEDARKGVYDVTAISFHAYAYVADTYALLPPRLVAHDRDSRFAGGGEVGVDDDRLLGEQPRQVGLRATRKTD